MDHGPTKSHRWSSMLSLLRVLILLIPILWSVVCLSSVALITRLALREKNIRLSTPIICTAGGKGDALRCYKLGSALASLLQGPTAGLWGQTAMNQLDSSSDPETVHAGAFCGILLAVFAHLTAHFSALTHEIIHGVVFALCVIFAWIWLIAVKTYTKNHAAL